MKFKSALITAASGSIGGMTAAHNKGGMYLRSRSTPINPNTPFQQAMRANLGSLATEWNDTLTDAQRSAWEDYASNVPIVDTLGEPRPITGLNWYVAINTIRLQAALDSLPDAPTIFARAFLTDIVASASEATQEISIEFDPDDPWATQDGGNLYVYASRPLSPTRIFYKGPYRFAGLIAGAATPPTSPQVVDAPFSFVENQSLKVLVRSQTADGRTSPPFRGGLICAA